MFIHDNGRLNVLSHKKCGHIAMIRYFGMNEMQNTTLGTFGDWISNPSPKVLVVRHPVERMHSAINWYKGVFESRIKFYQQHGHVDIFDLIKAFIHDHDGSLQEEYIFNAHCRPYLKLIKNTDFRIIKFEDLKNYIPKHTAHDTKTSNREMYPFPKNKYFNEQDMLQEIAAYEEILTLKEVITSEEWKELT